MDEEGGRSGAGTRHATPPPAGAAAGGRARTIAPYAVPPNGATLKDNNTGLDGGQDNGESSDAAQQHGTTPGTASAVFNSLGYAMAGETKTLAHHRIHLHFHPHNKKLSGPLEASYKMPPGY